MGKFLSILLLCIFATFAFAQSIDLLSPQDGYTSYDKRVELAFFHNSSSSDYDIAICDIYVDGEIEDSAFSVQTYAYHNSDYSVGVHSWNIICDQFNSTTNETLVDSLSSETRTFEILPTPATLDLISPPNNFQTSSNQITFIFLYSPNDEVSNPTCYLESGVSRLAQTSALNDDSTQVSATLPYGTHNWRIRCVDSNFEILSPIYSIQISSGLIGSGGGSVSTPYKRDIESPKPIEGPIKGPITGPLSADSTNLNESVQSKPIPQPVLNKAVLSAPQIAVEGEMVILRAMTQGGQPLSNSQIHIIDPSNEIIYIVTDSKGAAQFSPSISGLYMYKMPDFELVSLPTTLVSQKETPTSQIANEISTGSKEEKASEVISSQESSWIFWGGISIAFILASFLLLTRFSNDEY